MKIDILLKDTKHRPWGLPTTPWKFYQEWRDAIFLHYKVDKDLLKQFIPIDLELDIFDGDAWVSVVAFTMIKARPKNLPSFSPISDFHEVNIRTYVRKGDKAGVYFLSIEASKFLSTLIAKNVSGLPYRSSNISREKLKTFTSRNSYYNDLLLIEYKVEQNSSKTKFDKSDLDKWLTEKYALFQDYQNALIKYEIHHSEWPLNKIEIKNFDIRYDRFASLINNKPDLVHYSDGVQVIAWDKEHI